MAGIGNDDVGIGGLGGSVYQLLAKLVEADTKLGLELLGLVLDANDGLVVANWNVWVGRAWHSHHNDDKGALGSRNRAVDTHQLDLVVGMTYACRIDESERDATQLDGVFDSIAGGALNIAEALCFS